MARFNRNGKKNDRTITDKRLENLHKIVARFELVEAVVGPKTRTIVLQKWEAIEKGCAHWAMPLGNQPRHVQNAKSTIGKAESGKLKVISESEREEMKELSKKGPNARRNAANKGRRQESNRSRNRSHIDPPNDTKGWSETKKKEREGFTLQ